MYYFIRSFIVLCLLSFSLPSYAVDWSVNEIHLQHGRLKNPFTGTSDATNIITLQHASGWKYGDNFFFVDFIDDDNTDAFNDKDYYGEFYANFSIGKISGKDLSHGPLKDLGVILGFNAAGDADSLKYLPGLRLSWDAPGFIFLNTDFTGYIDDSSGISAEDDSFMIDVNWARPFQIGDQHFSVEGHIEYIGERDKEIGGEAKGHILAQPQFRWDIGHALLDKKDHFYLGVEYQYWNNKLGTSEDENAAQALFVVRM